MSKKHFRDLAERLSKMKPDDKTSDPAMRAQWLRMVIEMASFCASHGKNFDRGRFLTACGIED